jgi:serine/threonine-protein kinase ATR
LDGRAIELDLADQNRFSAIQMLHTLSEKRDVHLQETFVLAWGQVGRCSGLQVLKFGSEADVVRVVQDQELNVVLLKLLDYLGHSNPIVSGVAFSEVRFDIHIHSRS